MPKIRGVKPEFWTDDAIVDLSIPARLLFIGLWNYACDNGHLDDKPKQIKMRILPADDVNVDQLLDELEAHSRITRKGGTITIPKFAAHQRPHKRWWTTCDKPGCVVPDDAPPQGRHSGATVEQPLRNGSATVTDVTDVDVTDGEGDVSVASRTRAAARGTRISLDFEADENMRAWAAEKTPDVDIEAATENFIDYWTGRPGKDGVKLDWQATWRNNMRSCQDRGLYRKQTGNVRPIHYRDFGEAGA